MFYETLILPIRSKTQTHKSSESLNHSFNRLVHSFTKETPAMYLLETPQCVSLELFWSRIETR